MFVDETILPTFKLPSHPNPSEASFSNLQCLFYNTPQQRFLLGGYGDFLFDFDIERLRILRQITISGEQSDCILVKSSLSAPSTRGPGGIICTGSSNGAVILRDPSSLKSIHKVYPKIHSSCVPP